MFIEAWNGVATLRVPGQPEPEQQFFLDVSGGFGCGASWGKQWLQPAQQAPYAEAVDAPKELVPIVVACAHAISCGNPVQVLRWSPVDEG